MNLSNAKSRSLGQTFLAISVPSRGNPLVSVPPSDKLHSSFKGVKRKRRSPSPWLPDGYSQIFRILCVWPFRLLDYSSAMLRCKIVSLPFLGSKEKKGYNFAIWQPCPSLPCMSLPPRRRLFVLTLSICTRIHTRSGFHVGLGRGCVAFTFDIPPVMYASLLQKQ